jgi:hypothetical protein
MNSNSSVELCTILRDWYIEGVFCVVVVVSREKTVVVAGARTPSFGYTAVNRYGTGT